MQACARQYSGDGDKQKSAKLATWGKCAEEPTRSCLEQTIEKHKGRNRQREKGCAKKTAAAPTHTLVLLILK